MKLHIHLVTIVIATAAVVNFPNINCNSSDSSDSEESSDSGHGGGGGSNSDSSESQESNEGGGGGEGGEVTTESTMVEATTAFSRYTLQNFF